MIAATEGDTASAGLENRQPPRLAVLIPVFNDHDGLQKSLASLAQDGSRFDVFVVDDGSDPPIMMPSDLPFRARLLRQERNLGIVAALNTGLASILEAGYEYMARLDACDLSLPGRFAAQMAFLDEHPEHALVGAGTRRVDTGGRFLFSTRPPTDHDAIMRVLRYRSCITHASVMVKLRALRECGLYRNLFPGCEDYDLYMRLRTRYKLANLDETFLVVEIRPGSITSKRQSLVIARIRTLLEHFDPWSMHSYLGLIANAVLLPAPRPLMLKLKQMRARQHSEAT
jgi:glycosyltransferase involved in cell wall biosynthesis